MQYMHFITLNVCFLALLLWIYLHTCHNHHTTLYLFCFNSHVYSEGIFEGDFKKISHIVSISPSIQFVLRLNSPSVNHLGSAQGTSFNLVEDSSVDNFIYFLLFLLFEGFF